MPQNVDRQDSVKVVSVKKAMRMFALGASLPISGKGDPQFLGCRGADEATRDSGPIPTVGFEGV